MDAPPPVQRRQVSGLADVGIAVIWLALGIATIVASRDLHATAGQFPTLIGAAMSIIAVFRIVAGVIGQPFSVPSLRREDAVRASVFFLALILLWFSILLFGMIVGGFLWSMAIFIVIYRWSFRRSAIYATAMIGSIAIAFPALGLHLPSGLLLTIS